MTPLTIAALSLAVAVGIMIDQHDQPAPTVAGTVVERTQVDITPNLIRIDCSTNPIVEVFDSSLGDEGRVIDVCADLQRPSRTTSPSG